MLLARSMEAARQLLKQYLDQEKAKGVTHVSLNRELLTKLQPNKTKERVTPSSQTYKKEAVSSLRRESDSPTPSSIPSKRQQLDEIAALAEKGEAARRLGTLRDIMVFATGDEDADIMFIGEAPGVEEEKNREPFVGPAGQLLTKIIQAMGLRRGEVYISNICKFRPKIDDGVDQGSKNRAPTLAEMQACVCYVTQEIEVVQPKIIVALGATAATGLKIEGSVASLRGTVQEFRGIPVLVTYHPSYLLRREQEDGGGLREKRMVWEDMMKVMEHVGIPITPKQRAYFSKAGR